VYGSIISKKSLSNQSVLPLSHISLVSLPDEPGQLNAFEILSTQKSFTVLAATPEEKQEWIVHIKLHASQAMRHQESRGIPTKKLEHSFPF